MLEFKSDEEFEKWLSRTQKKSEQVGRVYKEGGKSQPRERVRAERMVHQIEPRECSCVIGILLGSLSTMIVTVILCWLCF